MLLAKASAPVAFTFSVENVNLLTFIVPKCGLWHKLISCGCTAHYSDILTVSPIFICDSIWKRLNTILLHAIWCYALSLTYMGFAWVSTAANYSAQIAAAEVTKLSVRLSPLPYTLDSPQHCDRIIVSCYWIIVRCCWIMVSCCYANTKSKQMLMIFFEWWYFLKQT